MKLSELGLDSWSEESAIERCIQEMRLARVTAMDRGRYMVTYEHGEISAELTGRFLYYADEAVDLPCVGDWVCVQTFDDDNLAIIHELLPRKTELRRKTPGRDIGFQMIAANIDTAFIMQSCHFDFNLRRLERYLITVNDGNIEPIIILSKTDLISPDMLTELTGSIKSAGIEARIITLSNLTGAGLDEIKRIMIAGKTYCLIGSSGVGKTTLINKIIGRDQFATKTLSETGEGRHATVRRQLIMIEAGAMLIDTPGMREMGIMSSGAVINDSFVEIKKYAADCSFIDCSHTNEPGCAVIQAVKDGKLDEDSYRNYQKLKKESDFYEMSYLEKRNKDKAFGKFIRNEKKKMKKYR